jgi:serine/threonine-protein phosphatase 2B regulatory subunit
LRGKSAGECARGARPAHTHPSASRATHAPPRPMGCAGSRPAAADAAAPPRRVAGDDDDATLSAETHFSLAEVHALRGLYARHANELHQDGLLHRDELAWALFRAHRDSLFVDRIFSLFDIKQNAVIEYGEFVRSLSVFHPAAPLEEKAACEQERGGA